MILKICCNKNRFYIEDGFNIISQCINSDKYTSHTWKLNNNKFITCFGKSLGKEKYINKFEIPPPLDNILFYNDVYFVYTNNNDIKNLSENNICKLNETIWNDIYEELFGGFETLDELSSGDDSDDSDDEYNHFEKTKEGYAKDGFIVDSEDEDDDDDDDDSSSEDEDEDEDDDSSSDDDDDSSSDDDDDDDDDDSSSDDDDDDDSSSEDDK